MSALPLLQPDWPAPANVRAVCTLREGGVGAAPYASLNLAVHVGDDPDVVAANRQRLREQLRLVSEPRWLTQMHGTQVFDADRAALSQSSVVPEADAATTRRSGNVLAVLVADCMPILLCRRDGAGVAVAHAGWRGLAAGVVEASVDALGAGAGAGQLLAWLGPAIGPSHFEVGDEVRCAFMAHEERASAAFTRNARGRWQCDLYQLARQRLQALGVGAIHGERRCTYGERESFFSYRRDGATGRFAALIWMDPGRSE
jgi:polyphenol oxidase